MEPKHGEFLGGFTNKGKKVITEPVFSLAVKPHANSGAAFV